MPRTIVNYSCHTSKCIFMNTIGTGGYMVSVSKDRELNIEFHFKMDLIYCIAYVEQTREWPDGIYYECVVLLTAIATEARRITWGTKILFTYIRLFYWLTEETELLGISSSEEIQRNPWPSHKWGQLQCTYFLKRKHFLSNLVELKGFFAIYCKNASFPGPDF